MPEDILCCMLCSKRYTLPKILDCLHTFCQDCLQRTIDDGADSCHTGVIHCPICELHSQVKMKHSHCDVNGLNDNTFISSFINAINTDKYKKSRCFVCSGKRHVNIGTPQVLIDGLRNHDARDPEVVYWCFDCETGLCEKCKAKHGEGRKNIKHDVVPVENALQRAVVRRKKSETYCSSHPDDKIKYYCVTCRSLACMQCTVISHKKHYCVSLKEALNLYKPEITGIRKKLKTFHSDIHELKSAIPAYLDKAAGKAERDIKEFFDNIIDLLRQKQAELLEELAMVREVEENKAFTSAELHDKYCRAAENMCTLMRYVIKYGSETEILHYYECVRKHDVVAQIAKQESDKLARYTFYKGNAVQNLINNIGQNLNLDISYFQGDFVPKALRLFKNSNDRVTMKCTGSSGKDATNHEVSSDESRAIKRTNKLNSSRRSQSISNLSHFTNGHDNHVEEPKDSPKFHVVEFTSEFEPVDAITTSLPPKSDIKHQTNPTNSRKLTGRQLYEQKRGSNLKSSSNWSMSVPDVSLLCMPTSDASTTNDDTNDQPEPIKEFVPPAKTGSTELNSAFERLRRLATGQRSEKRPPINRSRFRPRKFGLRQSTRFASMDNISSMYETRSESGHDHHISPTVMALHDSESIPDSCSVFSAEFEYDFDTSPDFQFDDTSSIVSGFSMGTSDSEDFVPPTPDNITDIMETDQASDCGIAENHVIPRQEVTLPQRIVSSDEAKLVFDSRVPSGAYPGEMNASECCPSGIVCLSDGRMVIADTGDNSVKLFTRSGTFVDRFCLSGADTEPRDITHIKDDRVAVLFHERHQILILSTEERFIEEKTITTTKGYISIANYDDHHMVLSCIFPSTIDVINLSGDVIKSIDLFDVVQMEENILSLDAWYIACNQQRDIIISEHSKKCVICATSNGSMRYMYKPGEELLTSPRGVCVDKYGNVLVVDDVNNNVQVLSPSGEFVNFLLTEHQTLDQPLNVALSRNNELIVAQMDGRIKVFPLRYES